MHSVIQEHLLHSQWFKEKWKVIICRCCHDFYTLYLEMSNTVTVSFLQKNSLMNVTVFDWEVASAEKINIVVIFALTLIELLSLPTGSPATNCTPDSSQTCHIHSALTTLVSWNYNPSLLLNPFLHVIKV